MELPPGFTEVTLHLEHTPEIKQTFCNIKVVASKECEPHFQRSLMVVPGSGIITQVVARIAEIIEGLSREAVRTW